MSDSSVPPSTLVPHEPQQAREPDSENKAIRVRTRFALGGFLAGIATGAFLFHDRIGGFIVLNSNALTALATVALTFIGIQQFARMSAQDKRLDEFKRGMDQLAAASQRSANIARETLDHMSLRQQKELRAYVSVKQARVISKTLAQLSDEEFKFVCCNFGKTPAAKMRLSLRVEALDAVKPSYGDLTGRTGSGGSLLTIGPGADAPSMFLKFDKLTSAESAAVRAGTKTVYVYGFITYIDVFDLRSTVYLSYSYNLARRTLVTSVEGNHALYGEKDTTESGSSDSVTKTP